MSIKHRKNLILSIANDKKHYLIQIVNHLSLRHIHKLNWFVNTVALFKQYTKVHVSANER